MPKRPLFYGWAVVWAAHLLLATLFAAAYSFSSYFAALQAEFLATRAAVAFTFSLAIFLMFFVGVFAGMAADRVHVRWVVSAGVLALASGFWVSARVTSLHDLYWAYGFAIGVGVGCAYVPTIAAVQPWFVRQRGLAAGIASAGIGLGTLIGPLIATALIERHGWRSALDHFAVATVVLGLVCVVFIEKSPAKRGLNADGEMALNQATPSNVINGMSLREALSTRTFWLFFCSIFAAGLIQFMPLAHLPRHALDRGFGADSAATLVGIIGLGSLLGRVFMTRWADRVGRRTMLAAMYGLMALSFAWWALTLLLPPSYASLLLFALAFGVGYGGFVGVAPSLTMDYFGAKNLSGLIGALYLAGGFATLFAPTFAGYMYDRSGSYAVPLMVGIFVNLVAATLALRLPKTI